MDDSCTVKLTKFFYPGFGSVLELVIFYSQFGYDSEGTFLTPVNPGQPKSKCQNFLQCKLQLLLKPQICERQFLFVGDPFRRTVLLYI